MIENLYEIGLLSAAVWLISTTIARARAFRPLRRAVKARSDYFGEGISCQYCISHWVGFVLCAVYQPRFLVSRWPAVDLAVSAFVVVAVGALIARTIGKTPPDGVLHPDERAAREAELQRQAATTERAAEIQQRPNLATSRDIGQLATGRQPA